ncbi:MAG: SDR family NAD(P)-dependent oxidoreductase [Alphaproteobacteria bacterium]
MAGLESFGGPVTAAVIGASGGIGGALARRLAAQQQVTRLMAFSRAGGAPWNAGELDRGGMDGRLSARRLDVTDEASIAAAAAEAKAWAPFHLVIVATGILHADDIQPEKTWRAIEPHALETVFRVNTFGPALVMKHFLPLMERKRKAVFAALSARMGSIGDNRLGGWYAYRASKAALNQIIRTAGIELARTNPGALCVGLHPGTVDTGLSKPFQGNIPDEKLFAPGFAAGRLIEVLERLTPSNSGHVFAWDGSEVPP